MRKSFKNILIPVDFSINTEVAVKKALELSEVDTTLHLLHVENCFNNGITNMIKKYMKVTDDDRQKMKWKMIQWKTTIKDSLPGVSVSISMERNIKIQEAIEKTAKNLAIDLIIIGKKSHHAWFPFFRTVASSKIAKRTDIPVLTVKPGAIHNKVKRMVVPVTSNTPQAKMEIIEAICQKFNLTVYLVTFMNNENTPDNYYASSLLQMFKWLKSTLHCNVEYAVLHAENKAGAILKFAEKINADILLVHAESETRIGWPDKHISDVLPVTSKMQVLAIQPAVDII